MVNTKQALAFLGSASYAIAQPSYVSHPERADAVKAAFQRSWDGYYQYAFPNDTLRPISKTYQNDRYVNILKVLFERRLTKMTEMDGEPARLMPSLQLS